ncbi:MAG: chromate efflux transporter [Legionella sp.]|uniref:chromate efflux transporter n=1 Tax=Legionella sp. TaxID=459 RepID=UPI002841FD7E|nr:chromate efflux transporter [Legionella sp.]
MYSRTHQLPAIASIFSGLQAAIVSVVANATLSFGKTSLKTWKNVAVASIAATFFWLMIPPFIIILLSALLGMLLNGRQQPTNRNNVSQCRIRHTTISLLIFLLVSGGTLVLLFFFKKYLFTLAVLMSKIDLMAFGGGFASVPLMFHEIVEVHSWMDAPTFLNGIILGQFTPGPIVITATFVGYLVHGPLRALIATIAIFLPSFLILIGIAPWFDKIRLLPWFTRAIGGILCSFVGLLFTVTIRFALNIHWDLAHIAFATAAFLALFFKLDILWIILAGTVIAPLFFNRGQGQCIHFK